MRPLGLAAKVFPPKASKTNSPERQEVAAVSKRKTVSPAVALFVALVACSPRVALGECVLPAPASDVFTVVKQPAPAAEGDASAAGETSNGVAADTTSTPDITPTPDTTSSDAATDDARQKRKESGFVSALTAPFRALARLFGGGSKRSKTETAKKTGTRGAADATRQAADASAAREGSQNTSGVKIPAGRSDAAREQKAATPAAQEASAVTRGAVGGSQQSQGVRVVRPGEGDAASDPTATSPATAPKPRMWIPVIEGISKDPLTQGRALLEQGYLQEAIAELSTAATVGPDLVEANNLLGLAYDRLGWHQLAAECYERALTVAPKDAVLLANLGYSLYLADDLNGALRRLKQAARLAPGTPVIYNNLGVVEARLGHYAEAFKYFAITSNEYDAHLKLASILEDQKRDREAVKHYEAALRMQPGTSAVLERLVSLYERTGARDKADQARRELGHPKNPQKTTTGGGG